MALLSSKQLTSAIKTLATNSNKFRGEVHNALISCAYQSAMGNLNYFNELLDAVGQGTRKAGIVLWAETYGYVQLKEGKFINNKASRTGLSVTCEEDFADQIELMNTNPHWADMVKKEHTPSMFDVSKYLTNVLAKLEKEGSDALVPFLEKAISEFNAVQALTELKALEVAANDAAKQAA